MLVLIYKRLPALSPSSDKDYLTNVILLTVINLCQTIKILMVGFVISTTQGKFNILPPYQYHFAGFKEYHV